MQGESRMELVIFLVIVAVGAYWYVSSRRKDEPAVDAAPYKVEAPVDTAPVAPAPVEPAPVVQEAAPAPEPKKCGCGRSASGYCVGLHALSADEWATHKDNPKAISPAVAENKPAKAPKAKKPAPAKAKKPAAITAKEKAPAKKPRSKKPAA